MATMREAGEYALRQPLMRRNAFQVGAGRRELPVRGNREAEERIRPTVSYEAAELSAHLIGNPVFSEVMEVLKAEAMGKLTGSPLGKDGEAERETGRYELAALETILSRIGAIASELRLHEARETTADD